MRLWSLESRGGVGERERWLEVVGTALGGVRCLGREKLHGISIVN
jgi:hypothetical protein